jgi:hypothetical protein
VGTWHDTHLATGCLSDRSPEGSRGRASV